MAGILIWCRRAIVTLSILSAQAVAQEAYRRPAWQVTVGAMGIASPRYPGSDEWRLLGFPMLQVTFRGRFFLGPTPGGPGFGFGARLLQTGGLGLAADVGISDSRPASRDAALTGMDDRDVLATVSASLIYRTEPIELALRVARGVNDGGGLLATTSVSLSQRFGRLAVAVGAGVTLADARQMRRDFGITPVEAARRQVLIDAGDPRLDPGDATEYQPGAGLRQFGGSLSVRYAMSQRWSLFGFGGVDWLSDRATESALVRRRAQASMGLGIGFQP